MIQQMMSNPMMMMMQNMFMGMNRPNQQMNMRMPQGQYNNMNNMGMRNMMNVNNFNRQPILGGVQPQMPIPFNMMPQQQQLQMPMMNNMYHPN